MLADGHILLKGCMSCIEPSSASSYSESLFIARYPVTLARPDGETWFELEPARRLVPSYLQNHDQRREKKGIGPCQMSLGPSMMNTAAADPAWRWMP